MAPVPKLVSKIDPARQCCVLILACCTVSLAADKRLETTPIPWLSGTKFEWVLDQPVIATWQNAESRFAARALSEQRRVPLVFDRRLDPNRMFSLQTTTESLREVFRKLAAVSEGSVSITSQTVYLGPPAAASKLRTLIALRHAEIQQIVTSLPTTGRKALTDRRPVKWEELDTPREIILRLVEERGLRIKGADLIPHDLWGPADLPPLLLAEALTLVLIQHDLTFRLNKSGTEVELVPIPEQVAVEKSWTLPRAKVEAITRAIETELPQVAARATAEQLLAQGTQEQLEDLERLILAMTTGTTPRKKPDAPAPLSRRKLTFQAKDAPLSAILEKLSETGIQFDYDRTALKRQGIDMDQLVAIDVKEVPPTELFDKLFRPLKLAYKVDGLRVTVTAE